MIQSQGLLGLVYSRENRRPLFMLYYLRFFCIMTLDMKQDKRINTITRLLEDLFEIVAVYHQGSRVVFGLSFRFAPDISRTLLTDRLRLAGYQFELNDKDNQMLLTIDPQPRFKIPIVNLVLFVVTLFTVYFVPVFFKNQGIVLTRLAEENPELLETLQSFGGNIKITISAFPEILNQTLAALSAGAGIEFTLAMISILFVHEMGHFVASRRRDIVTSWPYFIPAPNIIGTFGAIIKSKSPFWNRRDLIEVGSAGPIAGWIVAVGWLWYGLASSVYLPLDSFPPGEMYFSLQGESILMKLLTLASVGAAPHGHAYYLTEAAFAGWVGLLVTAINLLPIGQLDGGHIIYGLARHRQYLMGYFAMAILLALGMISPIWWFFAIFGIIFGVKHPPTLNDNKKPSSTATGMGIIALVILILSFTPIPFQ